MNTPRLIFFILFLAASTPLFAQELPSIEADRPDQTESAFTVPRGFFQIESGFHYENYGKGGDILFHPSVLWKFGLTNRFELRLVTELVTEKIEDGSTSGVLPVAAGFKFSLLQEQGVIPQTAVMGHLTSPKGGSEPFHLLQPAPSFRFNMQHSLSDRAGLGYNLGAEWDGYNKSPVYIYTLATDISLGKRSGLFVELYGFFPRKAKAEHCFSGGFTWLVNNNLLFDIAGSGGLTSGSHKFGVTAGVSWRFNTRDRSKTQSAMAVKQSDPPYINQQFLILNSIINQIKY